MEKPKKGSADVEEGPTTTTSLNFYCAKVRTDGQHHIVDCHPGNSLFEPLPSDKRFRTVESVELYTQTHTPFSLLGVLFVDNVIFPILYDFLLTVYLFWIWRF